MTVPGRRKFVLVEHSLRKLGGHYFLYALQILTAAEQAGYEPVLAVHREFRSLDRFPPHWLVLPLFRNRAQRLHRAVLGGSGGLSAAWARTFAHAVDTAWAFFKRMRVRAHRERSIREFREACGELFAKVPLRDGDLVYFSTIGDLDLVALGQFLAGEPAAKCADWHLQFHLPVYTGRDPEFVLQDKRVEGLRARFAAVRAQLPGFAITCHTTTEALTRQYHRIGETTARTLQWPVGEPKHADPRRKAALPLRLVLPGALRREKGSKQFKPMFEAVRSSDLGGRRIQYLVQCSERRREQDLGSLPLVATTEAAVLGKSPLPDAAIVALPHPLGDEAYERLIQTADVGVMIYGAEDYFARASGILVEFLAAGVPVVVPAGSWLSDEIQKPNDAWLASVLASATAARRAQRAAPELEMELATNAPDLLVRLRFDRSQLPGTYARIVVRTSDASGRALTTVESTVAAWPEREGALPAAMFAIPDGSVRVRVDVGTAFPMGVLVLQQLEAVQLIAGLAGRARPKGLVGLAVSDRDSVPRCIADLVRHHEHYRAGAQGFATAWRHAHAPMRSIEILTGVVAGPPV
jgi:hypothetical protein